MGGKITRLEVIDHTSDGEGRAYHKWAKEPFSVTYDIQDDGRTVKVFLGNPEWGIDLLATDPDDDVEATSNVQPNLTLDKTIDQAINKMSVLCEFPNDRDYCAGMAGQIRSFPITQDARKAIHRLITQARIDELERIANYDIEIGNCEYWSDHENGVCLNVDKYTEDRIAELKGEN